jgi:hypothetical protein
MRRRARILCALAVFLALGGCSTSSGPPPTGDAGFTSDGTVFDGEVDAPPDAASEAPVEGGDGGMDSSVADVSVQDSPAADAHPEAEAGAACNPAAPFGTPTLAPYPVDMTATDYSARLSSDLLTLYLMRAPSGGSYSIYTATRASPSATFGSLTLLPGVALGAANMQKPTVTGDQLTLYLDSDAPPDDAGTGGTHIWSFSRTSTASAFALAGEVDLGSPGSDDLSPFLLADGATLYFSSDRAGYVSPYVTTLGDAGTWAAPQLLAQLDSPGVITFDLAPSADGLTLYFASNRSGDAGANSGGMDVWVSRRASTGAAWGAPVHVDELATPGNDEPSWTSADGCTLWFSSSGPFGDGGTTSQAIYQATRGM